MTKGVAVIGTGYMAKKHCQVIHTLPELRLEQLCSTDRSRNIANEWETAYRFRTVTTSYKAVLEDPRVDIVLICSPDADHPAMTVEALRAGKHVLCEKPLARDKSEFELIGKVLAKSKKVLQVGMNCRFREQFSIPKAWTLANELGKLRFLRGVYLYNSVDALRQGQKPWMRLKKGKMQPFLQGGAIHCLDLLRWIGGKITSVFARAQAFELKEIWTHDTFSVSIEFEKGQIGELLASASAFTPQDFHLELWYSHGSIQAHQVYRREGAHTSPHSVPLNVVQAKGDLLLEWEDLLSAIATGKSPLNSYEEARANFLVMQAIEESIATKRPVKPAR